MTAENFQLPNPTWCIFLGIRRLGCSKQSLHCLCNVWQCGVVEKGWTSAQNLIKDTQNLLNSKRKSKKLIKDTQKSKWLNQVGEFGSIKPVVQLQLSPAPKIAAIFPALGVGEREGGTSLSWNEDQSLHPCTRQCTCWLVGWLVG